MSNIKFEEWRVKEIGELMVQAGELPLSESDRHKLFYKICCAISTFGLYETAAEDIRKIVEDYYKRPKS